MYWIRTASPRRHGFDDDTGGLHNARLRFILLQLERNPEWKAHVSTVLISLCRDTSALGLLSMMGLGHHRGFFAEASARIANKWLPMTSRSGDLADVFLRIFDSKRDAIWVKHLPPSTLAQVMDLVKDKSEDTAAFDGWRQDARSALLILGARIAALGTVSEVAERLADGSPQRSVFLRLSHHLNLFSRAHWPAERVLGPDVEGGRHCRFECGLVRKEVAEVYRAIEKQGVSVSLVYTLEYILRLVRRVEMILDMLLVSPEEEPVFFSDFLSCLVQERLSQASLTELVRANLHLLSRKVVERAGASGEHYFTRTRNEYFHMFRAGLGGGALMVIATLVKFFIHSLHLAPFFEGLFFSLNYSLSFVTLQLVGFTLATKQPSATASTLAGRLTSWEENGEVREFVNEACRMTRTQFGSLLGNLLLLVPLCLLIDLFVVKTLGHFPLGRDSALQVLASLDPLKSFSILMAAITGVELCLSSLVAGWFENWVVYRRLPEAISENRRLIAAVGNRRAELVGRWVSTHATVLGGNISLGFLMGYTSVVGHFLGLPFDVRHVTLSAASLTLALGSLHLADLTTFRILSPIVGVVVIGFFNFSVSYALALLIAARARNVDMRAVNRLVRAVRTRFSHHPIEFFFPPKGRSGEA